MASGYSLNPLSKKLGLKEGFSIKLVNTPANYGQLIGDLMNSLEVKHYTATDLDFIHFFTNSLEDLETTLPLLKEQIKKAGMIWVSWYKKSAGKQTELTENRIRNLVLSIGLVDVKVCAVDEDWSGLKLVYRTKDR